MLHEDLEDRVITDRGSWFHHAPLHAPADWPMCKPMTYRIAHLSDCHLGPLPSIRRRELLSKRVLGYINWQRNRAKAFVAGTTENLIADMQAQSPDHIAVTGDLVNLGLEAEFENAGRFLAGLGTPETVTAIPGNHDAYVPGALDRFNLHCAPYLTSDPDRAPQIGPYPVIRQRGPVVIVGLSTAHASGPFMASGAVDRRQRERMKAELFSTSGQFRVVLIHHPPFDKAGPWHKRLIGAKDVRAIWQSTGAELILHGHTHLPTRRTVEGPEGPIAVFGVASAAQAAGGHRPAASYTLFDVGETANGWTVTATRRGYPHSGGAVAELSKEAFEVARPSGTT
jgi:3',5'-cyclic AMP phosphodiesterase CpdA